MLRNLDIDDRLWHSESWPFACATNGTPDPRQRRLDRLVCDGPPFRAATMPQLRAILDHLEQFAPLTLAESWDNTGLLLGDPAADVATVLTCLTLSADVAEEAIAGGASLVVTHHPILFRPVQRLTAETPEGAMLARLIRAEIAVYSPHTAFDSTVGGINDQLAQRLGLTDVRSLRPMADTDGGAGRYGTVAEPCTFAEFIEPVKSLFGLRHLQSVPTDRTIRTVAVACGAGGEFLADARRAGCDLLLTGEARFHTALEARTLGLGLLLLGHFESERFAVETLAERLASAFCDLRAYASVVERNPLVYI